MVIVVSIIAFIWAEIWHDYQPTPAIPGRIVAMAPYLVLVTIFTGRVHRNTKLGLYNTASLHSNDPKSHPLLEPHLTGSAATHTSSWNSHSSVRPLPAVPFPMAVTDFDASSMYQTGFSTTQSRLRYSVNSLDFGMASD